jgi:hypothetical protein
VRPKNGRTEEDANLAIWTAIQLIARRGDRDNSHGFAILSRDAWFPDRSKSSQGILVGIVDPFRFLPFASTLDLVEAESSPLAKMVIDRTDDEAGLSYSINAVAADALKYLEHYCDVQWHPLTTWDAERSVETWAQSRYRLNERALPLHMEFWGNLGDYVREMLNHPALRTAIMPAAAKPGMDWTFPRFGIAMLNQIALPEPFKHGEMTCRGMCHLGIRLGRLVNALLTEAIRFEGTDLQNDLKENEPERTPQLEWAVADVMEFLNEIGYRWRAAIGLNDPPPAIALKGGQFAKTSANDVIALIKWVAEKFIGAANEIHYRLFNIAGATEALFEPGELRILSPTRKELEAKVFGLSRNLVTQIKEALAKKSPGSAPSERTRKIAREKYGLAVQEGEDVLTVLDRIAKLPDSIHLEQFVDGLPDIADVWVPPIQHTLAPLAKWEVDWEWLEQQIRYMRSIKIPHPVIVVHANGAIGTATVDPADAIDLPAVKSPENEVIVADDVGGVTDYSVWTWADLRAGKLFAEQ